MLELTFAHKVESSEAMPRDYAYVVASSGAFAICNDGRQIYAYYVDTGEEISPTGAGGSGAIISECDLPENTVPRDETQTFIDDWARMAAECRRQTEDQRRRLEEEREELLRQIAEQQYQANEDQNRRFQEAQKLLREHQQRLEEQERRQTQRQETLLNTLRNAMKPKTQGPPKPKAPPAKPSSPGNLGSINPLAPVAVDALRKIALNKAAHYGLSWAISEVLGENKKKPKKPKKQ